MSTDGRETRGRRTLPHMGQSGDQGLHRNDGPDAAKRRAGQPSL